jgi:hypothetical protein
MKFKIGTKVRLNDTFFNQGVYMRWENPEVEVFEIIGYENDDKSMYRVEPPFLIRFPNESYPDKLNVVLGKFLSLDKQYYRNKNLDDLLNAPDKD